jgi:hypothetical protein
MTTYWVGPSCRTDFLMTAWVTFYSKSSDGASGSVINIVSSNPEIFRWKTRTAQGRWIPAWIPRISKASRSITPPLFRSSVPITDSRGWVLISLQNPSITSYPCFSASRRRTIMCTVLQVTLVDSRACGTHVMHSSVWLLSPRVSCGFLLLVQNLLIDERRRNLLHGTKVFFVGIIIESWWIQNNMNSLQHGFVT